MKIHAEDTVTVTLTVTKDDARHLLADFDKTREPSTQGKRLYSTLIRIVKGEQTVDQIMLERFANPAATPTTTAPECAERKS